MDQRQRRERNDHKMLISDSVAKLIEELLREGGGQVEVRRSDLADRVGCAPSPDKLRHNLEVHAGARVSHRVKTRRRRLHPDRQETDSDETSTCALLLRDRQ